MRQHPEQPIRVGIVGAGQNTRKRHAPGFRTIPGVSLVAVVNRTPESSARAAAELDIPGVCRDWRELVDSEEVDAILIGTWPYLHCPITLAALKADKHVLTEARMAMDASEARAMRDASRDRPHLAAQVVPAPHTLKFDRTIQDLLGSGYLGDLIGLDVRISDPRFTDGSFADLKSPLHWRQDRKFSGFNIMGLGVWYEAIMRWVGPARLVTALTKVVVGKRPDEDGILRTVEVPDHVEVLARMADSDALAHFRFSTVSGLSRPNQIWIWGTHGTLHLDLGEGKLFGGRRGDDAVEELPIPREKAGHWRVEEEFIDAIQGKGVVRLNNFETGLQYMEFTEAVTRSAQSGISVALPL